MEMPNCNPLTVTHDALADKHLRAADHSAANYGFYFGATNDNLEAIKRSCDVEIRQADLRTAHLEELLRDVDVVFHQSTTHNSAE